VRSSFATVAQASSSTKDQNDQLQDLLDPKLNWIGLANSVDIHMGRSLIVSIGGFSKAEGFRQRRKRVGALLPLLSSGVVDKICSLDRNGLKRLSNSVEALKDNLLTSTPENVRHFQTMPEYQKLMTWAYSLGTFSSDRLTSQCKKFFALLKWKALRSETQDPEIPDDFPGFGAERQNLSELPPIWRKLCPWLLGVWDRGVVTKAEATRLCHLCTSRGMPAGGKSTREASLLKHAETLHRVVETTEVRSRILRRLSVLIGRSIVKNFKPRSFRSMGHLSLTSSASIDSPVSEGGRAAEVAIKYRNWATRISTQDVQGTTWFGEPYRLIAGRPVWTTMCREAPVYDGSRVFGESCEDMLLDFENFKYEDPLYGLDSSTGKQLLQWSIEDCLANGLLVGSPYREGGMSLERGPNAPSIRASAIGEPGGKSRIVTVGEDCLTIFLQPFSHHLIGLLRLHPSATAGLSRGWQGYEWVKGLRNAGPVPNEITYKLSSDLSQATDYCVHEYSLAMLEGLMEGLGEDNPYLHLCARVLCSPRRYESHVGAFFDTLTTSGVLMGDPGTKAVLTMHNLCAEWEAFIRHSRGMIESSDEEFYSYLRGSKGGPAKRWRHFACSGDDHTAQGPKSYLQRISLNHQLNGMSVSWSQNFLSSRGAFYCEEMILTVGISPSDLYGVATPLHERDYFSHPHIDAMKVRLLSPCAKEHEGKDEPNPAIGKARQVQSMLAWLGGGFEAMVPMVSKRFEQRMESFLPKNLALRYLPVLLGGIGAPAFHRSDAELRSIFRAIPGRQSQAIVRCLNGTAPFLERQTLATFATNARARGLSLDVVKDQIKEILSNAELTLGVDDSALQLLAGVPDSDWSHLRYSDKRAIAERHGFLSIDDALNNIDRPYLFRNMLAPEVSRAHGENPYKDRAYDARPWQKREEALYDNLYKSSEDPPPVIPEDLDALPAKLAASCKVHGRGLDVPKQVIFVPESVVVSESLCTLRVPLK